MADSTHNSLLMKNPFEVLGNCYVELKTVIKSCNYLIATMNEQTSKIVIDPHLSEWPGGMLRCSLHSSSTDEFYRS